MNRGIKTKRSDSTGGTPSFTSEDIKSGMLSNCQEYLAMVQDRNRRLKKLQTKDPKQIEMERREQGFTLYVNGANSNLPSVQDVAKNGPRHRERSRAKTADKNRGHGNTNLLNSEFCDNASRPVRTAPEKPNRRKWKIRSIEIKTESGQSVRIKPPVILTGNYSEDFDDEVLSEDDGNDSDNDKRVIEDDDDDDNDEDYKKQFGRLSDGDKSVVVTKENVERVSLTIRDIKKLRKSLELSASIRESTQEVHLSNSQSCLLDESIEEELASVQNSYSDSYLIDKRNKNPLDEQCEQILKPNDIIVLELASNNNPYHLEKQLMAAKRKDPDSPEDFPAEPTERRTPRSMGGSRTPRDERLKNRSSTEDIRVQKSKEILLRPVADMAPAKQRATSPSMQKSIPDKTESSKDTQITLEAVATENKAMQELKIDKKSLPQANGDQPKSLQLSSTARPPSATVVLPESQLELGGGSIENLVQKVLQLDLKGQHHLLKALMDIEQGVSMSRRSVWNQSNTDHRDASSCVPVAVEKEEVKREIGSTHQVVKICLCILSNWGHPGRVGLTGIELFDLAQRKVEVHCDDVEVQGANNVAGDLESLFSGKYKTVKERNMWSCDLQSLNPIRITITIKNCQTDDTNFGISKLKIWNYNKNSGELNKGVKHLKILKDGDIVFDGDLDKGCGNHVFDYGKVIHLIQPGIIPKSLKTEFCEEGKKPAPVSNYDWLSLRECDRNDRNNCPEQTTKAEAENAGMVKKFTESSETTSRLKEATSGEHFLPVGSVLSDCDIGDILSHRESQSMEECRGVMIPSLPQSDFSSILANQSDDENISMFQQIQKITKKQKKELPSWLNDDEGTGSHSRSKQEGQLANDWPNLELEEILEIRDTPSRNSSRGWKPKFAADDVPDQERDFSSSPILSADKKRAHWNLKQEKSLEESWLSLSLFNRYQKGRLSVDLEGDALDEYLLPPKAKLPEATIFEESPENLSDGFAIPELPYGQELVINILSTWGDKHYVGLNGIEIFTDTGEPAPIAKISAIPSDINVLPEYSGDPRVVSNLIDGINRTRDDTHMWLAPFSFGQKHLVRIEFQKPVKISLLRIWNYNKSRIHSSRGAKDVEVSLDGRLIFAGEIARSSGGIVGSSEAFGDTILFTTDEDVLELVSHYDQTFEVDIEDEDLGQEMIERPKTADKGDEKSRPFTSASHLRKKPETVSIETSEISTDHGNNQIPKGRCLSLNFTATWGDIHYLGLTGIVVLGKNGEPIPVAIDMVDANPRDLHVLPGYEADDRTLDKLIDGTNVTSVDEHMWLIPFTEGENHYVQFNFHQPTEVSGLCIWNYNKSPEDTYRGARIMHVSLDGCCISPPEGFLIRKGPGNCFFDFAQEVSFIRKKKTITADGQKTNLNLPLSDESNEEYEVIQKPCGFIYQLQLLSSWGDPYYLGLNGLEFYDADGTKLILTENNIAAYPDSVNVLEGIENDVRTPDKLIDGVHDTQDGRHMWLAPILPSILNRIYVIFDEPVELSMIKIWNYSKMPSRGVKDIALLVDDLLVYNGTLDTVPVYATGILPTVSVPQRYHTILFTNDKAIMQNVKHTVIKNQTAEQEVQLTNDHKVIAANSKRFTKPVDQALRPTTSVPCQQKRSNRHR